MNDFCTLKSPLRPNLFLSTHLEHGEFGLLVPLGLLFPELLAGELFLLPPLQVAPDKSDPVGTVPWYERGKFMALQCLSTAHLSILCRIIVLYEKNITPFKKECFTLLQTLFRYAATLTVLLL